MAKDYNQILLDKWYSQDQINQMRWVASSWWSSQDIVKAWWTPTSSSTSTPKNTSRDQWNGNYVYNEATWYYEREWTPRASSTYTETPRQETPTTPARTEDVTKTEDVVKVEDTVKQQWALKPLSQDYYNQTSQDAQDKIVKNLNDYKQSNPEYFTDYESFKRNFSYDARDDVQKNTLDQWYKWYQDWLSLSSTPTTDLYTQYKNWDLSDAQLQSLRVSDPTKYSELMNQINKWNIVAAYDDDKWMDFTGNSIQDMAYQAASQMFMQWINGDSSNWASQYFEEYRANMESPEMMEISDKTTELQNQIENVQDDIATMTKAVEKEYEWTWASRAKISAIVADRTYDLQLQLRTLNSEYNKYATQYNNRMQQYQNEFQLQLQEYQVNQQARQQQMQELWFAMDLMSFETPQQAQEREWNYWVRQQEYTNWNINSKDYSTRYKAALNSVQNLLSQYEWIPMLRSAEEMADDILKAIDEGSNLWAELTKLNKQIQSKDEYKMIYNATFSSWTWAWSLIQDTMKIWDVEWVKYGGDWYTASDFNKMLAWKGMGWEAKPYSTVDESVFSTDIRAWVTGNLWKFLMQKANGMTWWQCGKYVNDYLQYIWMTWAANRYYDDELSTKLNSINTYTPKVWSIAVFDYNHKSSDWINHGHVGIVTKVYSDWSFDVRDSNYWSDEKIKTRHIANDDALRGFFDPSQPPKNSWTAASSESFVSWSIEWVPLAYERAVKNLVPAALQNSDAEREALNTVITNAFNWWIDQSQIALTFMWFNIKNEEDRDLALDLVNVTRTLNDDVKQEWIVQSISDLINQWKYENAIQTVENAVTQQAKQAWNYVSEASVKNTINKANDLSEYMNWLKRSPVGIAEWTMQEWLNRLSSKEAKEISNRIALIESSLDIKDEATLKRIVPQLSDQPSVFMSKLQNLWNNAMLELNGWRSIYWLPELTQDSVLNYSNRVDLYKNWGASQAAVVNNVQEQSLGIENAIAALNQQFWLK